MRLQKPVEWMGLASIDLNLGEDVKLYTIASCICLDLLRRAWFLFSKLVTREGQDSKSLPFCILPMKLNKLCVVLGGQPSL